MIKGSHYRTHSYNLPPHIKHTYIIQSCSTLNIIMGDYICCHFTMATVTMVTVTIVIVTMVTVSMVTVTMVTVTSQKHL